MKKGVQFNFQCDQKWSEMKPVDGGSFCELCSKTVVDLDGLSEFEIYQLTRNNKNVCGKMSKGKPFRKEKPINPYFVVALVVVFNASLFTGMSQDKIQAMNKKVRESILVEERIDSIEVIQDSTLVQMDTIPNDTSYQSTFFQGTIGGVVVDSFGEYLPFVEVVYYVNDELINGQYTDTAGCFEFQIEDSIPLSTSYVMLHSLGYESKKIYFSEILNDLSDITIDTSIILEIDNQISYELGFIIYYPPWYKKPIYGIRNLFYRLTRSK